MKIKVVLADGRKILREGQSALLEKHDDLKVVGEADTVALAPKLVKALGPDVVVVNVGIGTRGVVESLRAISSSRSATRVIVLGLSRSGHGVQELLKAGAGGCLSKDCASTELVNAIRSVAARGVYVSPHLAEALVRGYSQGRGRVGSRQLSEREREVLARVADGQTTKEIAGRLKVSTKTVETHRRRLMEKLGRHSVAELTKYALAEGLVSMND